MTGNELYRVIKDAMPSEFEARQLFTHVTGFSIYDLPVCGGAQIQQEHVNRCISLCRRRQKGEPLQYLLGEWEFYGLTLKVGEGVLIPRADTERLVDVALELLHDKKKPEVLDLFSGSGCIALALAHCRLDAQVTAVELVDDAFGYLKSNTQCTRVSAIQADANGYRHSAPLDLITANPPYIPRWDLESLQPEVRREPRSALDGGEDGLDFYRMIASRYLDQLKPGGAICVEVGIGQSEDVEQIFLNIGFARTQSHRDLNGVSRVVVAFCNR